MRQQANYRNAEPVRPLELAVRSSNVALWERDMTGGLAEIAGDLNRIANP
jgi:hypothetical protein